MARGDADPRVRREAIRRIEAPRVLLELATSAPDQECRDLARGRAEALLAQIAADKRDIEESRRALALLEPPRRIAEVAVRAHFPALRIEALERLIGLPPEAPGRDDALVRVAGRAREPDLRRQALDEVRSGDALVLLASTPGAREAGQAAVRRLEDPDLLLAVANGKGAPAVRRLARRRADARLPNDHPLRVDERSRRIAALLGSDNGQDPGALAAAEALSREGPVTGEAETLLRSFREKAAARPSAGARTSLEVEVPVVPRQPAPAPAFPEVEPLLAEIEDDANPLSFDRIAAIERDVERLLEGRRGAGRCFERLRAAAGAARDAARERRRQRVVAFEFGELAAHSAELLKSLETRAESGAGHAERELGRIRTRYASFPEDLQSSADGERIRAVCERAGELVAAAREAREREAAAMREKLEGLEGRFESLETADPLPLREAEQTLRDLAAVRAETNSWKRIPNERRAQFERQRNALLPRIREARELQDWHRWSNMGSQAEIIRAAKGLLDVEDLARVDRELGKLERSWRGVRKADPERGQELWEAWTAVRGKLLARVAPLREKAAAAMEEKLAALERLVTTAEEIAAAGDVSRVAEMRDLMPLWREAIQGTGRRRTQELAGRFRTANDSFFAAWKETRKERQAAFAAAIATREALIGEAEALSEASSLEEVRQTVRNLMDRWKESPPVPRRHVEPLWNRFRDACDAARDRLQSPPSESDAPAAADPELASAFEDAVANLEKAPPAECVRAAIEIWPQYCRLEHTGETGAGTPGEDLLARLAAAFEADSDAFAESRFDQDAIQTRLAGIEASLGDLEPTGKAPPGEDVQAMAEHLARVFAQGGVRDREADALEAARTARQLLQQALAAGPALAPETRASQQRIRERVRAVVAAAPRPHPEGSRPRPRKPGARPPRNRR